MSKDFKDIIGDKEITEKFNNLPLEIRKIAIDSELCIRIRDLERLKKRIKNNYLKEVNYINDQINIYEKSIGKP
jgi:hypothetical protein